MANALLVPKVYANVMLMLLKNNLVMGRLVETDLNNLNPRMRGVEHKRGETIFVKRRPQFTIREGAVVDVQDVEIGEVPVVIDKQRGIDIEFEDLEHVTKVDDLLMSAILQEQAAAIAQQIDGDLIDLFKEFYSWVGTPGQTINSATDFFLAPERLDNMAVAQNNRQAVLAPADHWGLAGNFTSLETQRDIAEDALTKARIPILGSVQPFMSQNVVNLTTGTRAGTILVNGASQNVTYAVAKNTFSQSLIIDGGTALTTFVRGDTFTIAGVNSVNPRSREDLGFLQQFVILVDGAFDGSGDATVTISPPIIIDGAFQTVTAAPADGAALTFRGAAATAFAQNAAFHKRALALVFVKPIDPFTGRASFASDPESGIMIRYWRTSDGINDTHLHRWDVLYGVKMLDARLGTRISGTA